AVADDHIHRVPLDGQSLDLAFPELHVGIPQPLRVVASAVEHGIGHVHANHSSLLSDDRAGHESIEAGTGSEVEHRFTRPQAGEIGWDAASESEVGLRHVPFNALVCIANHVHIARAAATAAGSLASSGDLVVFAPYVFFDRI